MDRVYYLRIGNGLDVVRIAQDGISRKENDLSHADWNLATSALPDETRANVHLFCVSQGIPLLDWSVMAARRF